MIWCMVMHPAQALSLPAQHSHPIPTWGKLRHGGTLPVLNTDCWSSALSPSAKPAPSSVPGTAEPHRRAVSLGPACRAGTGLTHSPSPARLRACKEPPIIPLTSAVPKASSRVRSGMYQTQEGTQTHCLSPHSKGWGAHTTPGCTLGTTTPALMLCPSTSPS